MKFGGLKQLHWLLHFKNGKQLGLILFRRNAVAFRAIVMGYFMFVRSTRNQLLEYLENRLT